MFAVAFAIAGFFMSFAGSLAVTSISSSADTTSGAFAGDGTNALPSTNLRKGDIILIGTDDTIFDWLIPGKWSHTVIFAGLAGSYNVWDYDHKCWMAYGTPYVVHSTKDDNGDGLRTSTYQYAVNQHADNVAVLRVIKPGGVLLTTTEENAIVSFCTSKLGLDEGYDWNWLDKQLDIDTADPEIAPDGYYCSELAWAAVKTVTGIDLDGDFSPFNIGVSPEDLYWAEHVGMIACEMSSDPNGNGVPNTNGQGDYYVPASSDIYKVTMCAYQIRYDDDYDPWPSGDGEMYLTCWIGDAYFPSCAETHQTSDTNWDKIDDAGDNYIGGVGGGETITWNAYHYALVSYNAYCKVRLQTWEEDDWPNADDGYPIFQWWWSPSSWHGYINGGWYSNGGLVDYGDCRYFTYFRIDSCF